jgi:hypothetical protein
VQDIAQDGFASQWLFLAAVDAFRGSSQLSLEAALSLGLTITIKCLLIGAGLAGRFGHPISTYLPELNQRAR